MDEVRRLTEQNEALTAQYPCPAEAPRFTSLPGGQHQECDGCRGWWLYLWVRPSGQLLCGRCLRTLELTPTLTTPSEGPTP